VNSLGVFAVALGTAIATGLGVIPVLIVRGERRNSIGIANAVAAGFMLGATIGLIYEGALRGIGETALGILGGILFIASTRRLIGRGRDVHIGNLRGARGLTAVLVVSVMTLHSAAEGVAIGVSSAGEESLGLLIAVALAIHNIPEGVAVSLALMPFGVSAWRAAGWSIFSSLPQPLLAVPAFLAVRFFDPLLAAGLGFAAGAMAWMVFGQLLPQSLVRETRHIALALTIASAGLMILLEVALVI
jgi:zinc transporter, ZIP family